MPGRDRYKTKILICFILASLAIVAVSAVTNYIAARRLILDDAKKQSADIIGQLKNFNDMMLQNTIRSLYSLTSYSELETFGMRYYSIDNYHEKKLVYDRLLGLFNINAYFNACYVYYPAQASVVDINFMHPLYEHLSQNKRKELILASYRAFLDDQGNSALPIYPVADRSTGNREWTIVLPVNYTVMSPTIYPLPDQPILIVSLDSDGLYHNLYNLTLPEGAQVFIVDRGGEWIGAEHPAFSGIMGTAEQSTETGESGGTVNLNGENWFYSRVPSQVTDWQYFFVIPEKNIYRRTRFFGTVTLIVVVLCSLLGVTLALVLTNIIYIPIKQLSGRFMVPQPAEQRSALRVLEIGIDTLLSENENLRQRLDAEYGFVREDENSTGGMDATGSEGEKPLYHYPWDLGKGIIGSLRQGNLEELESCIRDFSDHISREIEDPVYCRFAFIRLFVDIIRSIESLTPYYADEIFRNDIYRWILNSKTPAETADILSGVCTEICRQIQLKKGAHTDEIALRIRDCIDKNFTRENMSLDFLADSLNFSVSYISKVFKLSLGVSVKEYITEKRIAVACDLIQHTDLHISEIGRRVGYPQLRSFIEIFKKHQGLTPTDYRKTKRRQPDEP
jgi:AraC-like DNA-binding protein